jgi:hypothetical protein
VIEVDDRFSEDDIDDRVVQDDIYDQILGYDIDFDTPQFDFVWNLPPFLNKHEGFIGIEHDLKQIMEQVKFPSIEKYQHLPSTEPMHRENYFNWIERYYWDVPYLQEQLN